MSSLKHDMPQFYTSGQGTCAARMHCGRVRKHRIGKHEDLKPESKHRAVHCRHLDDECKEIILRTESACNCRVASAGVPVQTRHNEGIDGSSAWVEGPRQLTVNM